MSEIAISTRSRGIKRIVGIFVVLVVVGFVGLLSEPRWSDYLEERKLASMQSKASELGRLCIAYRKSKGEYPQDFGRLAAKGLISNMRLKYLMSINDWTGYGTKREWAYGPDEDGILFCASEPVRVPISSVSGLMVYVACKNGNPVLLSCGDLPEYVHCDPSREILGKGFRLGSLCVEYSDKHGGHFPADLSLLVESGLTSQGKLERLLSIQDSTGEWKGRKWLYTPDDPEVLFCTSRPVRQSLDHNVWMMYSHEFGIMPVTEDRLPAQIREKLTK